jgi:hypothetical protein
MNNHQRRKKTTFINKIATAIAEFENSKKEKWEM